MQGRQGRTLGDFLSEEEALKGSEALPSVVLCCKVLSYSHFISASWVWAPSVTSQGEECRILWVDEESKRN